MNVFVCTVSQTFLSLSSLLSVHSVARTSLTVMVNTDNTLLRKIFDFSTIKMARVQTWEDVRHSNMHVCVHVNFHLLENPPITGRDVFYADVNAIVCAIAHFIFCVSVYLCVCFWEAGVIYEEADLWVR